MRSRSFKVSRLSLAIIAAFSQGLAVCAAEDQGDRQLGEMVVSGGRPAVPANLPASTEGVTAQQILETTNAVTSAGTIQNLPSVHVRERYIGDRNAIVSMRTNSSISSAQTIVYADHLLLSNFTNNSFSTPPRWGMVSPEEIERVDVIYGPFSALYPGNSMSGIVLMTTRMPDKFEAHAKVDGFTQRFKLYGTDKDFSGVHGSASVGDRFGDWSLWMSGDHLDSHGHPMTFGNAVRAPAGALPATTVSGGFRDRDTTGAPRIVTSAIGADHTVQDMGKVKVAYDFSPTVRATYSLGVWQNTTDTSVESYLRDSSGRPVYNTTGAGAGKYVRFAGDPNFYTLTGANPGRSESEHWMHGLSLKTNTRGEWDGEAVVSFYDEQREITRKATNNSSLTDAGTGASRPGTIQKDNGTGWKTLDLRGEWRPDGNLQSRHQVSFGYHYDRYVLVSDIYGTSDWQTGSPGALTTNSRGKTETQAVYLQDAWRFAPDWSLVAGGRLESWRAFEGSNFGSGTNVAYADRTTNGFSPKAMLSFQASDDWLLRGSVGKAYRFPTVAEMFQSINLPNSVKFNDPTLKPERVLSTEFAAERALANGIWRTSLFWEDKRDALISQTDNVTVPNFSITSVQNVDKIRTQGIEMALQMTDLWIRGFDLLGSVTYTDSIIERNRRNPTVVGHDQPRIPDWRATLVATYHASDRLSYSLAVRHSGRQWVNLLYQDVNPNVYGAAVSSYTVADAKVLYKVAKQWTAALGINNIGNAKYYVNPNPYPQRTFFATLKFDY